MFGFNHLPFNKIKGIAGGIEKPAPYQPPMTQPVIQPQMNGFAPFRGVPPQPNQQMTNQLPGMFGQAFRGATQQPQLPTGGFMGGFADLIQMALQQQQQQVPHQMGGFNPFQHLAGRYRAF